MPRVKFQTLTEQMFYVLLCLKEECCGMDLMAKIDVLTGGRVKVGPGTLYNLLEEFLRADLICQTKTQGRKRSYILTARGRSTLQEEYTRLCKLAGDYSRFFGKEGH